MNDQVAAPGEHPRALLLRDADVEGAWTVLAGGTEQSWVHPDDPAHLEYDYVQRIAEAIDLHAPPGERLRVVHVGGAGMTLARYVAATRPSSAQTVLEPDAELTQQVRELVPLPRRSGIKVRPVDGRSGITAFRDGHADLVIVDAFAGACVPAELTTLEWYGQVHRVLDRQGSVLINITDRHPFDYARRVAAGVQAVFAELIVQAESATMKGRRFGNLVLIAGKGRLPASDLVRRAASGTFPYRVLTGTQVARFIAGARPWTDAESAPSPAPARSNAHFG